MLVRGAVAALTAHDVSDIDAQVRAAPTEIGNNWGATYHFR
jgi:hypothetical protein